MSNEIALTSENFDKEVTSSEIPVLVDFWAEWCTPCKMIAPSVEQIAEAYAGKVKVGTINIDAESDLATRFGIVSIPTILVFKKGEIYRQQVGALPKHEIEALLKDL
jgi:thioredoxin 1